MNFTGYKLVDERSGDPIDEGGGGEAHYENNFTRVLDQRVAKRRRSRGDRRAGASDSRRSDVRHSGRPFRFQHPFGRREVNRRHSITRTTRVASALPESCSRCGQEPCGKGSRLPRIAPAVRGAPTALSRRSRTISVTPPLTKPMAWRWRTNCWHHSSVDMTSNSSMDEW